MLEKAKSGAQKFDFPFFRYAFVGGTTFLLDYVLNWVFINIFEINYLFVGYIALPIGLSYNFFMHKFFSFRDNDSHKGRPHRQALRYAILVAFNALANMFLMYVFYDYFALPLIISRIICNGTIVLWNFPLMRLWVYRR